MNGADPEVWVTGLGAVGPGGWCVAELWDGVVHGRSGLGPIERFDTGGSATRACGTVPGRGRANPPDSPLVVDYGRAAALEAWTDAGGADDGPDYMVVSTSGERRLPQGPGDDGIVATAAQVTGRLSATLGAHAELTVQGACAGGTLALGAGLQLVRAGMATTVVAGGADCLLRDRDFLDFTAMCAMSTRDCPPEEASCPFDRRRDGFVLAEGAAFLVLEQADHARRRGAPCRAVLEGFGSSQSAFHVVALPPTGEGPVQAMRAALADAGRAPGAVDYVNAHGTSTRDNDLAEATAIRAVFGPGSDAPLVSSTKGHIGHLMSAAGAVEAVLSVMALETGVVPATANLHEPDPDCRLRHVTAAADVRPRTILSNGFGFGGHCASVVLAEGSG